MIYDGLIEKVLHRYTMKPFDKEVAEAKREFFENAGILNEESEHFEMRMAQFLDWYTFTRELSEFHVAPVRYALHDSEFVTSDRERIQLQSLCNSHHGIFEYLKSKGSDIYVKDLFLGKKFVLRGSEVNFGFNADELFEARLLPVEDNFVFAKGFCFHPTEARKFILKEIKKVRKLEQVDRDALILRLHKMRYKHEQYRHIRIEYIYTNDSKLKF